MSTGTTGCQLSDQDVAVRDLPWATDPRGDDKTQLWKYALEHPEGSPIIMAVRDVMNASSEGADADYQLANRFYSSQAKYFKIDRRDRHKWVEPRPTAFHLTTSKHSSKPHHSTDIAKSNARAALSRRRQFTDDASKGVVLGAMAAKRSATDHKYLILQNTDDDDTHLTTPYRTRFNSPARVNKAIARYHTAWSEAAANYHVGILLTLTTDPSRYGSIADATEGLMDDLNRLMSWLANRFCDGSRPAHIAVPEFSQKGLPHLHVAIFGVAYVPYDAVKHYWDQRRDRAGVIWVDGMKTRGERWYWRGRHDRTEARSPQMYLGEGLQHIKSLATVEADCVKEAAGRLRTGQTREDDVAHEWWQQACRWALDVKLFTCSPSLNQEYGESTSCEAERAPQWRFIGASKYATIPGYIQRELLTGASVSINKPPPE